MVKTKIDWPGLDYVWNPVTGCPRNCWYCVVRRRVWPRINRFFGGVPYKEIHYHHEQMGKTFNIKKPSTFFIGFYSDNAFWDDFWWSVILQECDLNRQHTYMFLSKSLDGYKKVGAENFPPNCKQGLTIDYDCTAQAFCDTVDSLSQFPRPFLSLEPLSGFVGPADFSKIEMVIVGAMTGTKGQPGSFNMKDWIASVKNYVPKEKIHWKKNIQRYL